MGKVSDKDEEHVINNNTLVVAIQNTVIVILSGINFQVAERCRRSNAAKSQPASVYGA